VAYFASAGEAMAKALFFGGVTRRFPELNFAFLEGGIFVTRGDLRLTSSAQDEAGKPKWIYLGGPDQKAAPGLTGCHVAPLAAECVSSMGRQKDNE